MIRFSKLYFLPVLLLLACPVFAQKNGNFSTVQINAPSNTTALTAISPAQANLTAPIFAISRTGGVATVSTSDPNDTDAYALRFTAGASVTIVGVTADPSNAVNGTFSICAPPTAGCVAPNTYGFTFVSPGQNFTASSANPLGNVSVISNNCPLTPTTYFSFCGDPMAGAGLASTDDKAMIEFISTQDFAGSMLWASALGDGNTGNQRVTGCEQAWIESGNEWLLQCYYQRQFAQDLDFDMKNALFTMDVGDGTTGAVAGEFSMSGTRKIALFGPVPNRVMEIDMGAVPTGTTLPSTGTVRVRNGSTFCWENVSGTGTLCQGTNATDQFTLDGGLVTPTIATTTNCDDYTGTSCGSAAAGTVSIYPGQTVVQVNTTAVTLGSEIFVQEDASLGGRLGVTCNTTPGRTYMIKARKAGYAFQVVASAAPETNPVCLSYHIVN